MKHRLKQLMNSKVRKTIALVLAIIVTFATSYSLVLPAITLDLTIAEDMPGLDLGHLKNNTLPRSVSDIEQELLSQLLDANQAPFIDGEQTSDASTGIAAAETITGDATDKFMSFDTVVRDTVNGELQTIQVHVEAPAKALPENAFMTAELVKNADILETIEDAVDGNVAAVRAVSLSFQDADGEDISPKKDVQVTMTTDADVRNTDLTVVQYLQEQDTAETVALQTELELQAEPENDLALDQAVTFETKEPAVYAVVYTVDFHYDVDGVEYVYSIDGGSGMALSELLQIIGTVEDDPATPQDEVLAFVADVESVTFSDPSLVWVGQAAETTTIGALKQDNGLKIRYSSALTKERIAQINALTVQKSDWALISLQPFESEESLTITMKNGDVFTIQVTDATSIPGKTEILPGTVTTFTNELPYMDYRFDTDAMTLDNAVFLVGTTEIPVKSGQRINANYGEFYYAERTVADVGTNISANTLKFYQDIWYEPYTRLNTGRTYNLNDSMTIVIKDAVVDTQGGRHDLKLTLTVNSVLTNRYYGADYLSLFGPNTNGEGINAFAHIFDATQNGTIGGRSYVAKDEYGGVSLSIVQEVVGAQTGEAIPYCFVDIDQGYCNTHNNTRSYPNASGNYNSYEEQVRIKSGALSPAYIPSSNFLNVVYDPSVSPQNNEQNANGLAFFSTRSDTDTYNSGFIVMMDAKRSEIEWRGCACGSALYRGAIEVMYRPQYKPLNFGADGTVSLGDYTMGDKGGTIAVTQLGLWDENNYNAGFCVEGKNVQITDVGQKTGWRFKGLTSNNTDISNTLNSNGETSVIATEPITELVASYEPMECTIQVRKRDQDDNPLAGALFKLEGQCMVEGYEGPVTMYATSGDDGIVEFKHVPYGDYTLTEVSAPEGYVTNTTFSRHFDPAWMERNDGIVVLTNSIIVNTVKKKDLVLQKKDSNGNALEGAEFALYYINDQGIETLFEENLAPTIAPGETDARVVINDLPYGRVYKLVETTVPDGYVDLTGGFYFKIEMDGRTVFCDSDGNTRVDGNLVIYDGVEIYATSTSVFCIDVQNTPGSPLPNTGGVGTQLFEVLGTILILTSGVILLWRKRRTG